MITILFDTWTFPICWEIQDVQIFIKKNLWQRFLTKKKIFDKDFFSLSQTKHTTIEPSRIFNNEKVFSYHTGSVDAEQISKMFTDFFFFFPQKILIL